MELLERWEGLNDKWCGCEEDCPESLSKDTFKLFEQHIPSCPRWKPLFPFYVRMLPKRWEGLKGEKEIRDTIKGLEESMSRYPHPERNRIFISALKWVLDEDECENAWVKVQSVITSEEDIHCRKEHTIILIRENSFTLSMLSLTVWIVEYSWVRNLTNFKILILPIDLYNRLCWKAFLEGLSIDEIVSVCIKKGLRYIREIEKAWVRL